MQQIPEIEKTKSAIKFRISWSFSQRKPDLDWLKYKVTVTRKPKRYTIKYDFLLFTTIFFHKSIFYQCNPIECNSFYKIKQISSKSDYYYVIYGNFSIIPIKLLHQITRNWKRNWQKGPLDDLDNSFKIQLKQ